MRFGEDRKKAPIFHQSHHDRYYMVVVQQSMKGTTLSMSKCSIGVPSIVCVGKEEAGADAASAEAIAEEN